MKFITRLCFLALALIPYMGSAQNNSAFRSSNGYRASESDGAVAKLMLWQKFGVKHNNERIYDPQKRLLNQLGIRQSNTQTTFSEYQFYGGESYKGNNVPMASITDAEGNTYITGGSTNESQPAGDFFTMKVGPDGTILWQARKPAAKYAVEYGIKLLLNNDGNLVVTGIKWNGNDMDVQTIKYSPAGTEIWSTIYDSHHEGIDIPSAMVTGTDGSIYITGISWSGDSVDYLTIKYDTNGNLAWAVRDNGVGSGSWNEPAAIALDTTGNVIVAGYSTNPDGWLNYYTVKYNNNGEELWAQEYNYESTDPEFPADVTNSTPRAVTVDADNNVYVSGTFDTFLGRIGTIKYDAEGQQQWIRTYKSGTEKTQGAQIAINNNTVYVAGSHNGGFSDDGNVLISYTLDGTQNWVQESTDLIDAINVELMFDAAGNPVVAAKGMTPGAEEWQQDTAARAKKYSPEGTLLGQAAFVISSPEGLASMGDMAGAGLDLNGNVYMIVNSFYSGDGAVYEIVKSAFGETSPTAEWNTMYSNFGSPAASMLYSFSDTNGNTFSTGTYYTFADNMLNPNYFLVKHDADGNVAWEAVYNAENGNAANGIIGRVDAEGNAYVCLLPEFEGPLKVKKLSPAGAQVWETEVNLFNPQVYVMEPGPDGTIYLGGVAMEEETADNASFVAVKLNAAGEELWRNFMSSPNAEDNVYGISAGKVNAAGDLFLTGGCGEGSMISQNVSLAIVKFSNDGTDGWVTPIAVEGSSASGTDLVLAGDGSVYTNGFAQDNETGMEDIVTAMINPDGSQGWLQVFGDETRKERSYTIKRFSNGDLAVIGYSLAQNGDIHNTLLKYDTAGNQLWEFNSENIRFYNDFHIDGSDVCYIMDQAIIDPFPHKIFNQDFPIATLIRVNSEGNGEEEFFPGQEYGEFYGKQLIPHTDDRLLLGGSIANQGFFEGLYFFETTHDGTLATGSGNEHTKPQNWLGQNYPNPVLAGTEIPFNLIAGGKATIKLYNSQGRFIKEIANDNFDAGQTIIHFETAGLAPGIYLYQLTSGRFSQARKMIVK